MTRVQLVLVAFVAVLIGTSAMHHQAEFDAQKQSEPPHVLPPVSADYPGQVPDVLVALETARDAWITEQERIERERQEAERVAAEERARHARPVVPRTTTSPAGDCAALSAEFGVSAVALQRESNCTRDPGLLNASGCGGRGCIGPAQLDLGHGYAVSPWNPNVPGACADLDLYTIEGQVACARRLPASAW